MIVATSAHYESVHCRASYHRPANFAHVSSRLARSANFVALVSFRFISTRFVLSHLRLISSHLISFHFILCRARARAAIRVTMRENARGKRRFLVSVYFFFPLLAGAFYSAVRSAERGGAEGKVTEGREGGEVLRFIPVVNNIFIAASSEERRGVRKCNSGRCLPFPCTPSSARHDRAAPRRNSFVSERPSSRSSRNKASLSHHSRFKACAF